MALYYRSLGFPLTPFPPCCLHCYQHTKLIAPDSYTLYPSYPPRPADPFSPLGRLRLMTSMTWHLICVPFSTGASTSPESFARGVSLGQRAREYVIPQVWKVYPEWQCSLALQSAAGRVLCPFHILVWVWSFSDVLRNVEYWANLPTPYPLRIFLKPLVDLGN